MMYVAPTTYFIYTYGEKQVDPLRDMDAGSPLHSTARAYFPIPGGGTPIYGLVGMCFRAPEIPQTGSNCPQIDGKSGVLLKNAGKNG